MAFLVYFTNANGQTSTGDDVINIQAERVDQRITRSPLVYDRANKTEPKMRDLKKMRNIFIVTAFLAGNYDIDNDGTVEDAITQKHHIEDSMKDWAAVGDRHHTFYWTDRSYTGLITKVDITEIAGEENQYQVIIEFQEGVF